MESIYTDDFKSSYEDISLKPPRIQVIVCMFTCMFQLKVLYLMMAWTPKICTIFE